MNRVNPFVSQSYQSKIFRCYNPRTVLTFLKPNACIVTSSNTLLRSQRWLTFLYIIKRGWDRRIICSSNLSLLLKTDQLLESVVHLLDGLVFGQAHAALVRDIVDTSLGFGVLTVGAADLMNDQNIVIVV